MANSSAKRNDPLPVFCFYVRIKSLFSGKAAEGFFKSVSGLRSENEIVPVRAGGANDTTFNLVGAVKWSPIVLKQGFTSGSALVTWREKWATGEEMTRCDGSIIQLDTALNECAQWDFVRAWPTKWEAGELDASKNEVMIETMELCHEGLKYKALR